MSDTSDEFSSSDDEYDDEYEEEYGESYSETTEDEDDTPASEGHDDSENRTGDAELDAILGAGAFNVRALKHCADATKEKLKIASDCMATALHLVQHATRSLKDIDAPRLLTIPKSNNASLVLPDVMPRLTDWGAKLVRDGGVQTVGSARARVVMESYGCEKNTKRALVTEHEKVDVGIVALEAAAETFRSELKKRARCMHTSKLSAPSGDAGYDASVGLPDEMLITIFLMAGNYRVPEVCRRWNAVWVRSTRQIYLDTHRFRIRPFKVEPVEPLVVVYPSIRLSSDKHHLLFRREKLAIIASPKHNVVAAMVQTGTKWTRIDTILKSGSHTKSTTYKFGGTSKCIVMYTGPCSRQLFQVRSECIEKVAIGCDAVAIVDKNPFSDTDPFVVYCQTDDDHGYVIGQDWHIQLKQWTSSKPCLAARSFDAKSVNIAIAANDVITGYTITATAQTKTHELAWEHAAYPQELAMFPNKRYVAVRTSLYITIYDTFTGAEEKLGSHAGYVQEIHKFRMDRRGRILIYQGKSDPCCCISTWESKGTPTCPVCRQPMYYDYITVVFRPSDPDRIMFLRDAEKRIVFRNKNVIERQTTMNGVRGICDAIAAHFGDVRTGVDGIMFLRQSLLRDHLWYYSYVDKNQTIQFEDAVALYTEQTLVTDRQRAALRNRLMQHRFEYSFNVHVSDTNATLPACVVMDKLTVH